MLLDMGKDFCRTLAVYSEADVSYYNQIIQELHLYHESLALQANGFGDHTAINGLTVTAQTKNSKIAQLTDMFGQAKAK